jgi:hypothetical protein
MLLQISPWFKDGKQEIVIYAPGLFQKKQRFLGNIGFFL